MSYVDNRLVMQYKESPKVIALLKAFIDAPTDELELTFADLLQRLNIDVMEGKQLDQIGEIVGLRRPPSLGDEATYYETVFTYSETGSLDVDLGRGYGFGEYEQAQDFPAMADPDYRQFLKAKIIRNNSNKTLFDCEQVARLVGGDEGRVVESFSTGTIGVTFYGDKPANPAFLATLAKVAPVAGGIPINYVFDTSTLLADLNGDLITDLAGRAIRSLL